MPDLSDFEVGQTVEIGDGQTGIVQFAGNTHFAPGDWVGVAFDEPVGKNDGSVQGQRYFDCPASHGMFIRPAVARILEQPTPKPVRPNGIANGKSTKARTSIVPAAGSKSKAGDAANLKRQSINASSPTPTARSSRLTGSNTSHGKQIGSNVSSSATTPRTNAPTSSVRKSITQSLSKGRTSMGPPPPPVSTAAKTSTRSSMTPSLNGFVRAPSQGVANSKAVSSRHPAQSQSQDVLRSFSRGSGLSPVSDQLSQAETAESESPPGRDSQDNADSSITTPAVEEADEGTHHFIEKDSASRATPQMVASQRMAPTGSSLKRENDDLTTKLRLLEKKRTEDRERLRELDRIQADRDRFEGIIQKLQSKYQPQQQELAESKKQIKEAKTTIETLEAQQAENETLHEMATLDKEMAEEMAESAKLELQNLRQRQQELELEVEVLREENQELGKEISPEEKASQGWLQLERSNERYREALLRLRDITQQQENDLKAQIHALENDLQDFSQLKNEIVLMRDKLKQSDANAEDLRQQLDTALGAEDMIEELTQKNLTLNDNMDDLRATIEDLQSLKELNDELEINHTENEKQLQDEIDYQEALLAEEAKKSALQEGIIEDLDYTVSRFRELVVTLQNDLEDMKASQQISESQADDLNVRSRAIVDLNLKLQNSAAKAQIKAMDIELSKLAAQESAEHLAIVQLFLPESIKSERDSLHAFLRFRRLGFKAKMLCGFIRERTNDTQTGQEDELLAQCSLMEKLTWISSTSDRFIRNLEACDLETFKSLGAASFDLEPLERTIDRGIDELKHDRLKANQCVADLTGAIEVTRHLAEVYLSHNLAHFADLVYHHAVMMHMQLEIASIILSHIRSLSEKKLPEHDLETAASDDLQSIFDKYDAILSQIRSIKVVSGKNIRQIEELRSRSMTFESSALPTIEQAEKSVKDLTSLFYNFGSKFFKLSPSAEQNGLPSARDFATEMQSDPATLSSWYSKVQTAASHIQSVHGLTTSLTQVVEFSRVSTTPWKVLAQNMQAATADNVAREVRIDQLKHEVAEKTTTLALREKTAEELNVKLETLERRISESNGYRERLKDLERVVQSATLREKDLINKLTHLRNEYQSLDIEGKKLRKEIQNVKPSAQSVQAPTATISTGVIPDSSLRQIQSLQAEIVILKSTVKFLQNAAHSQHLAESLDFLSKPITGVSRAPEVLQSEAQSVIKEMLHLVGQDHSQTIALPQRSSKDRTRWRPVRETVAWQTQKQREEWEEWREWRDDVADRSSRAAKSEQKLKPTEPMSARTANAPLASLYLRRLGVKKSQEEVKIADPEEWERIEEALGLKFG